MSYPFSDVNQTTLNVGAGNTVVYTASERVLVIISPLNARAARDCEVVQIRPGVPPFRIYGSSYDSNRLTSTEDYGMQGIGLLQPGESVQTRTQFSDGTSFTLLVLTLPSV